MKKYYTWATTDVVMYNGRDRDERKEIVSRNEIIAESASAVSFIGEARES